MNFKKDATLLVAVYELSSLAYAKISISSMEKKESKPIADSISDQLGRSFLSWLIEYWRRSSFKTTHNEVELPELWIARIFMRFKFG